MQDPIDYWLFHDSFTVGEAALLIIGVNPSGYKDAVISNAAPDNFDAVFSAIKKAILNGKLKANIRHRVTWTESPDDNGRWIEHPILRSKRKEDC